LGSEALKRVVARQGNETAELWIVVSPGNIDPDADATATTGGNEYLAKLIRAATDWAEKLAGRISVVHVKRGDGSRQAFHDRYFCAVDQKGIPTAYLFSNSLSKAAGDWPFAICELDRVMSWRVYAYILEMIEGLTDGLQPEVIWKRANSSPMPRPSTTAASTSASFEPAWVAQANECLADIRHIIIRNSEFRSQVGARVDAFLRAWPTDMDMERFAEGLFKVVSHRDAIVVFVSDQLRNNGRAELANMLDDKLLNRFLATLPGPDRKGGWFVPFDARRGVLENLGTAIARKENATNFLRAKFNPKVAAFVAIVETQRFEKNLTWDAHEAALFLCIIALKVAVMAEAPAQYRIGVAADYTHWLGRLMRSDAAANVYVGLDTVPPEWLDDLVFAAQSIAKARFVLGEVLDVPIGLVKDDPWVASIFKANLESFLAVKRSGEIAPN
jgi:hypothetical protein